MNENEGVSVVICCYNSSNRIVATLEHLQKVTTKIPWEIVLVDNDSDDDTVEKSVKIWNENPITAFTTISELNRGLMNARLAGARSSKYSIISFIDDDNWISIDWIDKVFSIMHKDATIAACGGSSEGVFEIKPPDWFKDFAISYAVGSQQNFNGYVDNQKGYLWGAGITIRKKVWDSLFNSGFKSLLKGRTGKSLTAGEDSEICLVLILQGWKLWYDDSLNLKHYIPASRLTESYVLKMYEGFGKAEVILSLYRDEITASHSNKASWLLQSIASFKKLCHSGFKSIFSTRENGLKSKALWAHEKAYTLELLKNRNNYNLVKYQIQAIKKNIT